MADFKDQLRTLVDTYIYDNDDAEITGGIMNSVLKSFISVTAGCMFSDSAQGEIFNDYTHNIASGSNSHAEGSFTEATGADSHTEGTSTAASGRGAHAEGDGSKANGRASHAEGYRCEAVADYTHAEGYGTKASSPYAHAEGYQNEAAGLGSHAEGYNNKPTGDYSHIEGDSNNASGKASHAEGYKNTATGDRGHVEGSNNTASATCAHAEGDNNRASGQRAHAQNGRNTASGTDSHAGGYVTVAAGRGSLTAGVGSKAYNYAETALGCYNITETKQSPTTLDVTNRIFGIGGGVNDANRSQAFKVLGNGTVYADNTTIQPMADYAEMFEWLDGNPEKEDRVGYMAALLGNKIVKASGAANEMLLGIISGAPTIIGDAPMRWAEKYINDEWGRPIYEDITFTETELQEGEDEEGNPIVIEVEVQKTAHVRKLNPAWDPTKAYIPREQRPEWAAVGLLGKILVRQDGTLKTGSFCKPNSEGIATKADSGYYVLEVINDSQARVFVR